MGAYLLENTILFLRAMSLVFFGVCMLVTLIMIISVIIEEHNRHKDN